MADGEIKEILKRLVELQERLLKFCVNCAYYRYSSYFGHECFQPGNYIKNLGETITLLPMNCPCWKPKMGR